MTTFAYGPLASGARRLIAQFGRTSTITRRTQILGGPNPQFTDTEFTVIAVTQEIDRKDIDGTLIRATDRMALVEGQVEVQVSDRLTIGSERHEVIKVRPVQPGALLIYQELVVRGA